MSMKSWAEDACEQIDSGFFTGDTFNGEEELKEVEEYIGRWQRQCVVIRASTNEDLRADQKRLNWIDQNMDCSLACSLFSETDLSEEETLREAIDKAMAEQE